MSYQTQQLAYLSGLLILVLLLWDTATLYPLKILVVFFHESSHAIATVLSGGSVKELVINKSHGGHVLTSGGNRFFTLSAGYLGSLLWGLIIFFVAFNTHRDRWMMGILGSALIIITLLYASDGFSISFGLAVGAVMVFSSRFFSATVNDIILRVIGMTNMLYVPLDIYSDTISRSHLRSDARMLAEEIGGTTLMWGGIWLLISLVMIFYCFRWSLRFNPNR